MFQQPRQGDRFDASQLNGSLVLIWVKELRKDVPTQYEASDAIAADVAVLDGAQAGEKLEDTLIFPRALVGALRNAEGGDPVLGRVGQSTAKPGQNPAWILLPFTDADAAVATTYIQNMAKPFQAPAGTTPAAAAPAAPAATTLDLSALDPAVIDLLRKTGAIPA